MASFDGGASWAAAGSTAAPAVIGHAMTALGAGGSALIDAHGSVEIELLNDAMWLEGRSDAALAGGANLALLGDELIQFGSVEPLGEKRFRLSRLLRGRRGSEWAAGGHVPGEAFVLIDAASVATIEAPPGMAGGEVRLMATGIGDEDGVTASRIVTGEAIRPPSPVHLRAVRRPNDDISIGWVRRSRSGWDWLSGSDTPLGEERELYRVTLSGSEFSRSLTVAEPQHVYSAAQQAADGLAGTLEIEIVQLGTAAASRPALLSFN